MLKPNLYWRGGVIWARVQIAGKDCRRSLRTSDRKVAQQRLKAILDDADRMRFGDQPRRTYRAAVVAWAAVSYGGVKDSTASRYRTSLRQLDAKFGEKYLDQVTKALIGEYVTDRAKAGATNATIRRDLTALSRMLGCVAAMGWIDDNPAETYSRKTIKERRDPIERPDNASMDLVFRLGGGNFGRLLEFLLETGMRLDEAAALLRRKVSKAGVVELGKTKNNSVRTLQLSERAHAILKSVPAALHSPYVFWSDGKAGYYKYASRKIQIVRRRAQKAAQASGVEFRPFRIHDLRHEFAIRYLKTPGNNIYDLQAIMGHSSIAVTEGYLEFLTPAEKDAVKHAGAKAGT